MAQIPVYTRLTLSDAPNAQPWVGNMFNNINLFAEQNINALGSLSIGQNVQGQISTTKFTTPATYTAGDFTQMNLNYKGGNIPSVLFIGKINNLNGTRILTPVTVTDWIANINVSPPQLKINYIAGLANSTTYQITLLAF